MILVTGGAGFIGSTFILEWLDREQSPVINLNKRTDAGLEQPDWVNNVISGDYKKWLNTNYQNRGVR